MTRETDASAPPAQSVRWYDLFSRGARDWLRHNEKVRESVKEALPELVAGGDVISNPENRVVSVPVRFLEHYRFRLRETDSRTGAGQGQGAEPGRVLRPGGRQGHAAGGAGTGEGGLEFVLELKVDDILDWIWEELGLPHLEPRPSDSMQDTDFVREGIDKRGVRARLDRRRTLKEAVKRRAVQDDAVPFTNDDLRFRQIAMRPRPSTAAVIFFVLDVSSSMDEQSRKLSKTFFFWALQGLRRQHTRIESVFVGHTVKAWEFNEEEFFSVRASGGTEASKAFELTLELLATRYDPGRYNTYLFYASDGDNFAADHDDSSTALRRLAELMNYMGYVEIARRAPDKLNTEMGRIFRELEDATLPVGSYGVTGHEDIWSAIREFFTEQAGMQEA